jgi:hypothetical protein
LNNLITKNPKIFLVGLLLTVFTAVYSTDGSAKSTHVSLVQKSRLSNLSLKDSDFNGDRISDPIVKVSIAGRHLRFGIKLSGQTDLTVISLSKTGEKPLIFTYDIDADGDTDIVAEYLAAKSTTVFLNDGQGKFKVSQGSYFHNSESSAPHKAFKIKKDSVYFNFLQKISLAVLSVSGAWLASIAVFVVGISEIIQQFLSSRILLFLTYTIRRRGPPFI